MGSPRATSYFHISDNLHIKFDNNDKKGNLGNQWQSLISSLPNLLSFNLFADHLSMQRPLFRDKKIVGEIIVTLLRPMI